MLEMMVFAVILVLAQIVAGTIMFVIFMKVMASEWFAKMYMKYFMKMMSNLSIFEMDDIFKEGEKEEEL